ASSNAPRRFPQQFKSRPLHVAVMPNDVTAKPSVTAKLNVAVLESGAPAAKQALPAVTPCGHVGSGVAGWIRSVIGVEGCGWRAPYRRLRQPAPPPSLYSHSLPASALPEAPP